MASSEKRQLEELFKLPLKQLGFRKRGGTWHRSNSDTIHLVNIQGSQWSKVFYVNLGVYYTALGTEERPAEYDCHVCTRLSQLVPEIRRLAHLLDLHSKEFSQADGDELLALLLKHGMPWLEQCSTRDGLLEAAAAKHPPMIHVTAKEFFGVVN
jgi:hypothetical protein